MPTVPPACPRCKGSRVLVVLYTEDEWPDAPVGLDFIKPRPICPDCNGRGTLEEEELGEYELPPEIKKLVSENRPSDDIKAFESHPLEAFEDEKPKIHFSPDQQAAIDSVMAWMDTREKRKSLGGYAGTGKTTIISHLLRTIGTGAISVCAPTGKAAAVLRSKNVPATTLHKLVYMPQYYCSIHGIVKSKAEKKKVRRCNRCGRALKVSWVRVPYIDAELVIVDESSMLNLSMVEDVESLASKILYVGDHGQLEPIGRDPGIMQEPEIRLEEIHRQAAHSGIIQLAHHMRQGWDPRRWDPGTTTDARVAVVRKLVPKMLNTFDIILCGYNKTRKAVNAGIRRVRGFKGVLPEPGERLICLQNDTDLGVYNGLLVTVVRRRESDELPKYDLVDDVGNTYDDIHVLPEQFVEEKKIEHAPKGIGLFDFGYCLTVHKCVRGDTLVQTDRGWSRIDRLAESKGLVSTAYGPQAFSDFVRVGRSRLFTLTCEGGYSVSVTPDHRIRVWKNGKWDLIRSDQIECGDFLRLKLGGERPEPARKIKMPPAPPSDTRAKRVKIPRSLSSDLAEFLGLMVSDGTIFDSGIRLAKRHDDVVERFAELGKRIFGIEPNITQVQGTPAAEFISVQISRWLKLVGGMTPHEKRMPSCILACRSDLRSAFLRGLFADGTVNLKSRTNGTVVADHIEWANKDPAFVRAIQVILLEYGIISGINLRKKTPSLYIYSRSIHVFANIIGFVSEFKQSRARMPIAQETKYRIPIDPRDFSYKNSFEGNAKTRGYITRESARGIERMSEALSFHYVRVSDVKEEFGEAYCLTVPESGSFLQNGFDGSNSQGSEWDKVCVLEQIAASWSPARWRYTAATRAAKKLEYWLPERGV